MRNNRFSFDGSKAFYIKLPNDNMEEKLEITLVIPESLKGKYLAVVLADDERNIPAKNSCSEEECYKCRVVYCPVNQEFASLKNVDVPERKTVKEDDRPIIRGHVNCRLGDCLDDCHNVSCAIHQGFSPIPTKPEDC